MSAQRRPQSRRSFCQRQPNTSHRRPRPLPTLPPICRRRPDVSTSAVWEEIAPKATVYALFDSHKREVEDDVIDPSWTLLRYLRDKLRLVGTKLGCAEGGCGACTVMVSKIDRITGNIRHFAANACLLPVCSLHGLSVTTVEGIGSTETRLHPVQERLALSHGSQCGFCTPGFVMSMYTLLRNCPNPTMEEIEDSLVGNLCRCTGYRPILEGFRSFTKEAGPISGCGKSDCCQLTNKTSSCSQNRINENGTENGLHLEKTHVLFDPGAFTPYDPSQEIIFPPELKLNPKLDDQSLTFEGQTMTFYRPASMEELLRLKRVFPHAKIVVGNTEVGVEMKLKRVEYPAIIHPGNIPQLLHLKLGDSFVEVGAALSLTQIETEFKKLIYELPGWKTRVLAAITEMLKWFAGRQIRNVAGLGGNIMTGSPISDLNPILMASGAKLIFRSVEHEREIPFDDKFYTGYRRNIARADEILTAVKIRLTNKNEYFKAYKQSRRRDDDIAIVNAAFMTSLNEDTSTVTSLSIAFGGMAPTTIMAKKAMEALRGRAWDSSFLEEVTSSLLEEMTLSPSAPGGMVDYRRALTASLFFKFYLSVCQELQNKYPKLLPPLQMDEKDIIKPYESHQVKCTQFFQNVPEGQEKIDPVGRPIPHLAAFKQTTGEAIYLDDIPRFENELFAALVLSSHAHAQILNIDPTAALEMEGVEGFFTAKDVPGDKKYGILKMDMEVFASTEVHFVGEIIGIIVAKDQLLAQRAAREVKILYEDLSNPIYTIEDAIKYDSFSHDPVIIERSNVEDALATSPCTLQGEMYLGGQEHFYLETNVHIAVPGEGGELQFFSSTQCVTDTQTCIAKALGVPSNLVTCKIKRIGGGFGGKEFSSISIAIPVAVAAVKLHRPVRIVLDRDEDMLITGGRNPFLGRWTVGFNETGRVEALDLQLFCNGGYSLELSGAVVQRAALSANNAYNIKHMRVKGYVCKTNLPSNTAFRGFGSPQACLITEDIITKVAEHLGKDIKQVRELNLSVSGSVMHYGQKMENCNVRKCWNQVLESADYKNRHKRVKTFNTKNRYRKRGISVIPIRFGIAFGPLFMNQSGALVLVYKDGSVLISHGAMEMGQGIHTKMIQVASRVLGIPCDMIHISETASDKVPNTPPTAASCSSDLNGMAIVNACEKILARLEKFKKRNPNGEWKEWVNAAFLDRVSLSATGFYSTPDIYPYCPDKKEGRPFNYFSYGAAVSEVEVDCLTGDHTVLRTDIVMDVGNSLNPAIDVGQIEGGFLQGYGLFTLEQLVFSSTGALITRGPGAYKIPSIQDIPKEFNISLLRDSSNPRAVFSSKAVGEPPMLLAASVFFAIREAVKAARESNGGEPTLNFNSPATAERIRMACTDHIINQVKTTKEESAQQPWSLNV